ncbi:hypothetical protein MCOR18_010650 [Pyricularia oryzae]|nr:hypothetical protein MCOR18_010650 [Pyricularia oryzae]
MSEPLHPNSARPGSTTPLTSSGVVQRVDEHHAVVPVANVKDPYRNPALAHKVHAVKRPGRSDEPV